MSAAARRTTTQRERRTVTIGATVVLVSLFVAYAVLPFVRHWQLREASLEATRAAIASLAALDRSRATIEREAAAAESRLAGNGRRMLHARSIPLAASGLQSYLQEAADASGLVVTRLDVATAGDPAASDSASSLPATLSAYGDIHGLAELLSHLEHGPRALRVERMTVQQNSALRGAADMLQLTIALRAPVVIE